MTVTALYLLMGMVQYVHLCPVILFTEYEMSDVDMAEAYLIHKKLKIAIDF